MMAAETQSPSSARQAISAAKVQIGRSGRFIGQEAIQLHGGIGMTMEYERRPLLQARHHDRFSCLVTPATILGLLADTGGLATA